jgi:hypothetical protein
VGDLILTRNVVPGGASNVLADTALVRSVGVFDDSFMTLADWDLWTRLGLAAPLATVDRPLHGYYVHAGSMAHDVRRTGAGAAAAREEVRRHQTAAERGARLGPDAAVPGGLGVAPGGPPRGGPAALSARPLPGGPPAPQRECMPHRCSVAGLAERARQPRPPPLPPEWRTAVEEWLEPLRQLDGRTVEGLWPGRATAQQRSPGHPDQS